MSARAASPAEQAPSGAGFRSARMLLLRGSLRSGRVRFGLVLVATVTVLALFGPFVAPHPQDDFVGTPFAGPSREALLGTDYLGQDVLSRVLYGGRSVLWMSFAATALAMVIGVTIGLVAAYSRSLLDDVLMRAMDIPFAFPQMVLVLLFVSLMGPKLWLIVLLVAVVWLPPISRVTRGATLEVMQREYVQSAEALGVPRHRILAGELLPNVVTPLAVEFGLRLTWSIALIAGVSFLGFGIQPPSSDWGLMISENRTGLSVQPWGVVVPIACIVTFVTGANLVADGVGRTVAGVDRKGGAR